MKWFSVLGLSIYSEVPLPARLQAVPFNNYADIVIVMDPFLKNGMDPGKFYSSWSPSIATLCVPDTGVLRMMGGVRMIVSPFAGADEDRLQQLILKDGMNAIVEQRGFSVEEHKERETVMAYGRLV
ncbi:hypothetical protein [Paenibacillus nanensis]|nr:hypothetical protein [Paenibacillus nanensis]